MLSVKSRDCDLLTVRMQVLLDRIKDCRRGLALKKKHKISVRVLQFAFTLSAFQFDLWVSSVFCLWLMLTFFLFGCRPQVAHNVCIELDLESESANLVLIQSTGQRQ